MEQLEGRVAVVTGAANGIGAALARQLAGAGVRLALADIDADGLAAVAAELEGAGAQVLAVPTDVSSTDQVGELAERVAARFGPVHLLCNQAGTMASGWAWEHAAQDWDDVVGTNLGGVVNTVRAFLPGMLAHGDEGHVVNAASIGALSVEVFLAPYMVALSGVVTFSEGLALELSLRGSRIGVSVVCCGAVATGLATGGVERAARRERAGGPPRSPVVAHFDQRRVETTAAGAPPQEIAELIVARVREGGFWIVNRNENTEEFMARLRASNERVLAGQDPVLSPTVVARAREIEPS